MEEVREFIIRKLGEHIGYVMKKAFGWTDPIECMKEIEEYKLTKKERKIIEEAIGDVTLQKDFAYSALTFYYRSNPQKAKILEDILPLDEIEKAKSKLDEILKAEKEFRSK